MKSLSHISHTGASSYDSGGKTPPLFSIFCFSTTILPTSICRLFFLTSQPNRIGTIGPCHAAVLLFPNHSCISPVYKVITKCLMHHRAPGKFRESIIARSLELKWFTTVMHHLGNVLLQKKSFLLPVCCWKNNLSLCRRGELLNFLSYRTAPKNYIKASDGYFYLPSTPKNRFLAFFYSFPFYFPQLHFLAWCSKYSATKWLEN